MLTKDTMSKLCINNTASSTNEAIEVSVPKPVVSVSFDEAIDNYHTPDEYLNKSKIVSWIEDPLLFARPITKAKSSSLTAGDLVHLSLELGEEETKRWQVRPEQYSTASGWKKTKAAQEFLADQAPDIKWISQQEHYFLSGVWKQIHANSAAQRVVDEIEHHEVSIRWEREDGTKLKCRPDGITRSGRVCDWKTCRYANPLKDWWKAVKDYSYHAQDALYREGAKVAGWSDEPLIFVLISTTGSYQVQVVTLPQDVCVSGKRLLERGIEGIAAHNTFGGEVLPQGYGEINTLSCPSSVFSLEARNGSHG